MQIRTIAELTRFECRHHMLQLPVAIILLIVVTLLLTVGQRVAQHNAHAAMQHSAIVICNSSFEYLGHALHLVHQMADDVHFCRAEGRRDPFTWVLAFGALTEDVPYQLASIGFMQPMVNYHDFDNSTYNKTLLSDDTKLSWQVSLALRSGEDDAADCDHLLYALSYPAIAPRIYGYCTYPSTAYVSWVDVPDTILLDRHGFHTVERALLNWTANPPPQFAALPVHPMLYYGDFVITLEQSVTCDYIFLPNARTYGIVFAEQTLNQFSEYLNNKTTGADGASLMLVIEASSGLLVGSSVLNQVQTLCAGYNMSAPAFCRVNRNNVSDSTLREVIQLIDTYNRSGELTASDAAYYARDYTWQAVVSRYTRPGVTQNGTGAIDWWVVTAAPTTGLPTAAIVGICTAVYICVAALVTGVHALSTWCTNWHQYQIIHPIDSESLPDLQVDLDDEDQQQGNVQMNNNKKKKKEKLSADIEEAML